MEEETPIPTKLLAKRFVSSAGVMLFMFLFVTDTENYIY